MPNTNMLFFDLDGTLVDTSPDMGGALNRLLTSLNKPEIELMKIKPKISEGCAGLLKLALGLNVDDPSYHSIREQYLSYYDETFHAETHLFPGMNQVLNYLDEQGILFGIVTNKPKRFSHAVIKKVGLFGRVCCIVSGDDISQPKPAPESLLLACQQQRCVPADAWYVGDAKTDVIAAHAAKMKVIVANYGFIPLEENTQQWLADGYIDSPMQLMDFL